LLDQTIQTSPQEEEWWLSSAEWNARIAVGYCTPHIRPSENTSSSIY